MTIPENTREISGACVVVRDLLEVTQLQTAQLPINLRQRIFPGINDFDTISCWYRNRLIVTIHGLCLDRVDLAAGGLDIEY